MFEGVYHLAVVGADWAEAFENEMEAVIATVIEEDEARDQQLRAASRTRTRDLAKQLVAHPAFNSGRVSFAKRRFLAGELFPQEEAGLLDSVVELAENLHWLATTQPFSNARNE